MDKENESVELDPTDMLSNPTCENSQCLIYRPKFGDSPAEIAIKCGCCFNLIAEIVDIQEFKLESLDIFNDLIEKWHQIHPKSNNNYGMGFRLGYL